MMTEDQLVFLFVPEMVHLKDKALEKGESEAVSKYMEIIAYVKTKVELDSMKIRDDIGNPKFIVPSPDAIINKRSPKDVPNN